MSVPAVLPLSGVPDARPARTRGGTQVGLRAGERRTKRTSLFLRREDELLLDALRDHMGPDASIGETLRRGLQQLAIEQGIDIVALTREAPTKP